MFLAVLWALALPTVAVAEEHAVFLNAPGHSGSLKTSLAGQFELRLRLTDGRLARALLDVGVNKEDAAAAARLAAGHLGNDQGGCQALVSIERAPDGAYSLMRVQLTTADRRSIIEWRGTELILASDLPLTSTPTVA